MSQGQGKRVVLHAPGGHESREVLRGTPYEQQLREKGWGERRSAAPPESGEGSRTAAEARVALATLSPEDWIRDWGHVLCAALDESERARSWLVRRTTAMGDAVLVGMESMKTVTQALTSWMMKTGWVLGKSVLPPTIKRQEASEDLVRHLYDVATSFRGKVDAYIGTYEGDHTLRGDPTARARASEILAELSSDLSKDCPPGEELDRLRASIAKVRGSFLGGSNAPPGGGEEEPS